jgi:hypothetical protein
MGAYGGQFHVLGVSKFVYMGGIWNYNNFQMMMGPLCQVSLTVHPRLHASALVHSIMHSQRI